jgi:hypothetical protein
MVCAIASGYLRNKRVISSGAFQQLSGTVDSDVLADAGDDVLQVPPFRRVIEHVVHGNQRYESIAGNLSQLRHSTPIIAAIEHAGAEPNGVARRGLFQPVEQQAQRARVNSRRRHDNQIEAFDELE